MVILGHNLGNSQVSVYRTIGPTLVKMSVWGSGNFYTLLCINAQLATPRVCSKYKKNWAKLDSYGKLLHKLNVRIECFCYVIEVFLSYLNDMTKFNYQFIYTFIHFAFLFVTTPIFLSFV